MLTFISKCAGVSELDFEALVHDHDLSMVVYNAAKPPSLVAAAEATPKDDAPLRRCARAAAAGNVLGRGVMSYVLCPMSYLPCLMSHGPWVIDHVRTCACRPHPGRTQP